MAADVMTADVMPAEEIADAPPGATVRRRVLVVTLDTLAARMAGPAIRAWRIAAALSADHDVDLVTFARCELDPPGFRARAIIAEEFEAVVAEAEVVVLQGFFFRAFDWLRTCPQILVVDLYDPFHLESLEVDQYEAPERRRRSLSGAVAELAAQIRRGDYFLCASTKQRDFWLGHLAALGRINPDTYDDDPDLDRLLAVVPFGVDVQPGTDAGAGAIKGVLPGIGHDDLVLLWGGGVYNWFDPLTLVRAVDRVRRTVPTVRLVFLGMRHPNPDVPAMRVAVEVRELAATLGLTGTYVFFNEGWVPHDERHRWLGDSDIGVSCHFQHLETAFSFRTRILDYLWAGLPIVATDGDGFADLVRTEALGAVVPAEDDEALAEALVGLLADESERRACAERSAAVSARFLWSVVLRPVVEFCADPRPAPDRQWMAAGHVVAEVAKPARPGVLEDLRTAARYLRSGGPVAVVRAARSRVDRRRRLGV